MARVDPAQGALLVGVAWATGRLPDRDKHYEKDRPRGAFSHSTLAALLLGGLTTSVVLAVVPTAYLHLALFGALGVFAGYWLHVVADTFTPQGTHLFWPLRRRPVHALPVGMARIVAANEALVGYLVAGAALGYVLLPLLMESP